MLIRKLRQCSVILALLIVVRCPASEAKIYERCELARELHYAHRIPLQQIATWVCIAQRESFFNTAAVGRLNGDGSADHGIFQISDLYWCSHGDFGAKSCNLRCKDLLDNDITNDVSCVKTIYEEHARLSGDGFTAWTTYESFCRNQDYKKVAACFANQPKPYKPHKGHGQASPNLILDPAQVSKKYESNPFLKHVYGQKTQTDALQTPAATNVNTVFSHNYPSNPFLHPQVRPTGSTVSLGRPGNAVSFPFPKQVHAQKPKVPPPRYNNIQRTVAANVNAFHSHKGKVYTRCSFAQELFTKHSFPLQDIATWVCIVEHQSSFDSAAVGRTNGDGSANYGLFQISDRYWCSNETQREPKACNIACHKLTDADLSDDVRCVKTIYAEHSRISGDGFNAWAVYTSRCQNQNIEHIRECFDSKDLAHIAGVSSTSGHEVAPPVQGTKGKTYQRCELAQELYYKHKLPMEQIPTWVCIAHHESRLNTAAVGRLNTDGSADHGLFKISDLYWCSHDRYGGGKACNIPCDKLLDSDISDDVRCIQIIHEEHTRISGDGFNAWTVYGPHCKNQQHSQISQCFDEKVLQEYEQKKNVPTLISGPKTKGKVYQKCELAKELYHKHRMPMEQIPTWVCIAQHESSFNTAAVGRLNTDGSADHGLFQISDLYWCSHDRHGGKACNIPCDRLLDADISDDVRCIKIIHEEHTRISGDGFNAWTVYKPHCRHKGMEHVKQCFTEQELKEIPSKNITPLTSNSITPQTSVTAKKGKIYSKCELAQELYKKHQMPMEQIPTWVCIAQHESSFNTAAVGRLNTDGSADHGLFQISDLYWCSHDKHGGKACNIPCDRLLDADISDDVRCIKIIHEEHTRISGDGFNAWTVYKPHCRHKGMEHVKQCFTEQELLAIPSMAKPSIGGSAITPQYSVTTTKGKIYNKCELAQELYKKHQMPMEQIPTWVCIAQHESSFNTAAVGRLNTDGSADHGLFQISDLYWCSHDQHGGKACNIPCDRLLDADISDDVRCIKIIHEEHTRISGDGFNAWTVYKPHCRHKGMEHVKQCFTEQELIGTPSKTITPITSNTVTTQTSVTTKKGKIYSKCELAQELYHKHHMPMEQIPTWVCIAQHESSFNTAAVGRLNTDGSADHGLFQISDLYWCSHDQHGGKACNIPCDRLLDADISDDVRCIKIIHEEHTRISGDGFNAWTVYKPHCRHKSMNHIKPCFSDRDLAEFGNKAVTSITTNAIQPAVVPSKSNKGKIYKKCELAQELLMKHKMPMEQIPIWVCIAQHESSFNTAAVGRLNTDGSADHGLFQISDLYWCSHDQHGGKACNIPCDKLLDADISDDVRCIKIIHEEHTQISGDGFNAWTVYKPHCRNRKMEEIRSCFSSNEIELYEKTKVVKETRPTLEYNKQHKPPRGDYQHNPFLNGMYTHIAEVSTKPENHNTLASVNHNSPNYLNNPFLQTVKKQTTPEAESLKKKATTPAPSQTSNSGNYKNNPFLNGILTSSTLTQHSGGHSTPPTKSNNFQSNSFLNEAIKTNSETVENYKDNPFLNGPYNVIKSSSQYYENYKEQVATKPNYNNNPFLSASIKTPTALKITPTSTSKPAQYSYSENLFLTDAIKIATNQPLNAHLSSQRLENISQPTKNYLDSNNFRTKTTAAPKPIPTTKRPNNTQTTAATNKLTAATSTSRPKTTTTKKPLTAATKPQTLQTTKKSTTTTRRPSTTAWTTKPSKATTTQRFTSKYKDSALIRTTTTPTKKATPTTGKPTTTTHKPATTSWTTKPTKATTSWNQHWLTTTTLKPTTTSSTTKKPTTATTRTSTTTKSPPKNVPTSKSVKTSTTWSWDGAKPKQTVTTKKPTTTWTTTKKSLTTRTTTKYPLTTRFTTKQPTTTRFTTSRSPTTTWTTSRSQKTTAAPFSTRKTTPWINKTTKSSKFAISWNSKSWQQNNTISRLETTKPKETKEPKGTTLWTTTTKRPTQPTKTTKRPTQSTRTTTQWTKTTKRPTQPIRTTTQWTTTTKRPTQPTKTATQSTTTTRKPTQATTTTKPQTAATKIHKQTTKTTTPWNYTTKRPTQPFKTTTSWSWDKANLKQSPPSATTTRKPLTTTTTKNKPTIANNSQWIQQKYTTSIPSKSPKPQTTTTTKRPSTTRSWKQAKYSNATITTRRPPTTRSPTTKWNSKTTIRPQQTTTWQPHSKTTSKTPTTTHGKTIDHNVKLQTTTTKKPATNVWHNIGDKTTTKLVTSKTTTTTQGKPANHNVKLQTTTTKKPGTNVWQNFGDKTTPKAVTTKSAKQQVTTNWLSQGKVTTSKPATTKTTSAPASYTHHKTTTPSPYAGALHSTSDSSKIKNDPFKHSFFDKVKQEMEYLRGNLTIAAGPKQVLATRPPHFENSSFYQDYKNSRSNATKTIVSYNYTPASSGRHQTSTTKRPQRL